MPVLSTSKIVKIKVYDRRGTVAYSTDPTEIGDDQSGNDGVLAAFAGRAAADRFRDRCRTNELTLLDLATGEPGLSRVG